MAKDFIKEYWNSQAAEYEDSHWASWGDHFMVELEIDLISELLEDNDHVLDVGCANGYSTVQQLNRNNTLRLNGIDFSEEMIRSSLINLEKISKKYKDRLQFSVGDVRNLEYKSESFDKAYTTRVLINLPSWDEQQKGVTELLRIVKSGGKVILLEAFWEPLVLLNSIRSLVQLEPLVEHDFNRYLKIKKLEEFLSNLNVDFERIDFSSVYYLGSRFLRELTTKVDQYEGYSNPINEIFYNIEKEFSGGGFGIQQAYVITKL